MKKNKLAKMAAAVLMTGSIAALGTSKVNAEDGASSATQKSSTATFTIDTSKAKLTLDEVPSFDFGSVDPADIYAKKTVSGKGSGEIQVTDTRLNATGWNLAVSTTTALTNSSSSIEGDLTFTPTSFSFTTGNATGWTFSSGTPTLNLPSTSSAEIASSIGKDKGTGSATVSSANLKFTKNNTLAQGKYTSNLTWNLGTTTDESGRASE
ncbi:WxL domain-containing protein [Lactobacillus johnsonii]|uniref:WxL domain-containing protein n=1 Tax=Lactobacillus johnsonii TaxID=33959 RepID=UPI001CBC058C|nr:WxL domain-containing protein [Lactobacillus johnsonii]MBZ4027647.1 WxL domain-containing protein [Lactobacillus johnsonii]